MRVFKYLTLILVISISIPSCKDNIEDFDPEAIEDKGPENSSIPYFVINSLGNEIVDEPKVRGTMAVFVNQEEVFSSRVGIELRGSTSRLLFPKKSYGIEFWDEAGKDISLEILDFGKEEDWVLHGPYSDKTLFRNVLMYDLARDIGQYAVKTRMVELSLNNDFLGTYVFMENIKRDGDRLPLEPMNPSITGGDELTGGYILKIDKTAGDTNDPSFEGDITYSDALGFRSDFRPDEQRLTLPPFGRKQGFETYFLYEYPRHEEINNEQKAYIENYIRSFEEALVAEDFSQSTRVYEQYIDVDSFVDFFILNELSANPDAYRLSTYMHKFRNGKLKMGPVWDFNLAFGNDERSATNEWIYRFNDRNPQDIWLVHFWYPKLLQDPKFRAAIKTRWNILKSNELASQVINSKINQWVTYLQENGAVARNFDQWPVLGESLPFNSFVGSSYNDEVDYVKNWIAQRVSWMDGQIQAW